MIDERPKAMSVVNVGDMDAVAAAYALAEVESAARYWAKRIGFFSTVRGDLDQSPAEVELVVKVAKLEEAERVLRRALYQDPDLDDGNHFAGMPDRAPGLYQHRVSGQSR